MKHTICIPYSPCGGKFKNGKELRYALRGFDKHFQGEYEVVLVGPKKPDWYQGTWLKQTQGKLKSALKLAADTYPDGFFWWYDDCVLIQDQTGEQLMATPARKSWGRIWTSWGKKLEEIRVRLEREGYTPWDYSKPHGPYWFDKGMIDESFADWPNMAGKFPFESWILSKRDHPRRFGVEAQYYNEFRNNPSADKIFVNWCDRGFTPELIAWLDERFSVESNEEIGNVSPEENITAGSEEISHTNSEETIAEEIVDENPRRVLFTCHEGCDGRIWGWCGNGIRAFANSYQAKLVELPKCLDANPQWVLFDAFTESLIYPDGSEFAWVDSDLVISNQATNIWELYAKKLHVCPASGRYRKNLHGRMGLPTAFPRHSTGVVKWNREEAEKLSKWYAENKQRFLKTDGDQELLAVACHELGIVFSWFHRKMHVAGNRPPPRTAFKHKGGRSKIRWIPKFLEMNQKVGIQTPNREPNENTATGMVKDLRFVYINMDKDVDRRQFFLNEFPDVDWWRFPGCEGGLMWGEIARGLGLLGDLRKTGRQSIARPKWGTFGCSLSHVLCLKMATISGGIVLFPDDLLNTRKLNLKELVDHALKHRPAGVGWIKLKNQKPLYDTRPDSIHESGGYKFRRLAKFDRSIRLGRNTGSAAVIILREQAKAILKALPTITSTPFDNELQAIVDQVPGGCWEMLNTGIVLDPSKSSVREEIDAAKPTNQPPT